MLLMISPLTQTRTLAESWNPSWSVASILTGLLSFMLEDTQTTGSLVTSSEQKQTLAEQSWAWNRNHMKFQIHFADRLHLKPPPQQTATSAAEQQRRRWVQEEKVLDRQNMLEQEWRHFVQAGWLRSFVLGLGIYLLCRIAWSLWDSTEFFQGEMKGKN